MVNRGQVIKSPANNDTITALATPPGRGGVGIVRVSGPRVKAIAETVLGLLPPPRYATYTAFLDINGTAIDEGLALYFPGPHSFTGEDVIEFQGHGGPVILDMLIRRILELGARLARPGEFSERAFHNNKLDLTQAEAIADLIEAGSEQAARAALRSLQGEFSSVIHGLVEKLIQLRIFVEAAIDFPEEEIDFLSDGKIAARLEDVIDTFNLIHNKAQQGAILKEGITIVIAGKPNAGKSSLLNSLTGKDTAIVTDIPGTTRDVLREYINIDGIPLHIIDTAGLRDSSDRVEQEGIRRAWNEIKMADQLLIVTDSQTTTETQLQDFINELTVQLNKKMATIVIRNKIDLLAEHPQLIAKQDITCISLSARTGEGIDILKTHLKKTVSANANFEGHFIARRRHLDALNRAQQLLLTGRQQLLDFHAGELLAEDLRQAQLALNEITGEFTSDDLLGKIFSSFCIGK